ncbi:hypothetical protein TPB0596_12570 [Tsukamurella pulmonis]|uniref:hypothetical protein n=1 Tax=Tsukamurella pulmonis TaxID=47312 RepID=UPI001EDF6030|nr:hypothetical protein [Tsukamurella pulmonis]BDD81494.1 hypothetical protein TPB0596_12570 [Tsukamurella pulmonis]
MTSPDMQSPVGALAPNVVNTLQEFLASPIGAEAEEILGALAQFGDSLVARFFRGYTSVVDIFDHAFDELGAELGGIPGMSGVTAWVTSIEELVGTAMRLIDGVFDGVQEIANGLSKAVTGKDIEGNIAEGMHGIVEGLTFFLKLVNLAMDLIQELIDGVLGVAGGTMSQLVAVLGWVIDIANQFLLFFHGFYDVFKGLFGWSTGGPNDRPLEKLFDSIPNLLTAFSPLNAAKLVGEIPGALLQGVQDAIDGVSDFLQDLVNAILRAIRGIPVVGGTLADIIAEVGGLQQKAVEAKSTATSAQSTAVAVASSALTTTVVNSNETITRTVYGPGSHTWNRPAPSSGKKITKFGIHVIGAGQAGGKAEKGNGQGAKGGLDGGSFYLEVLPADMPSSLSVAVANGPAGATSTGPGAMPGPTRVMNGANVFAEATMGAAFAKLVGAIPVRLETKPGRGGDGGDALLKDITTDSNGAVTGKQHSRGDGEDGESCAGGPGGAGGRSSGGWLGGSQTAAQPGPAARTDPIYRFGASGAGGGYAGPNSAVTSGAGAAGGNPGGGGGGGGGSPYSGFGGGTGNGGAGGPGEVAFYVFEEPL